MHILKYRLTKILPTRSVSNFKFNSSNFYFLFFFFTFYISYKTIEIFTGVISITHKICIFVSYLYSKLILFCKCILVCSGLVLNFSLCIKHQVASCSYSTYNPQFHCITGKKRKEKRERKRKKSRSRTETKNSLQFTKPDI